LPRDRHRCAFDAAGRYSALTGHDFRMAPTHRGGELVSVVTDHHQPLFGGVTTFITGC
jgi:hypothetical protein